ncbi:hypothetical protein PSTT_03660 [Puccinia striiformis]|uniref:Uncharacterized protein n=1 Tax=Puccinia striiformis TaxID=27350 RepID=A0A2S4VVI1_9BASI|nr:hypothetical protein PSTT_03660 [Puccinia striiformis]
MNLGPPGDQAPSDPTELEPTTKLRNHNLILDQLRKEKPSNHTTWELLERNNEHDSMKHLNYLFGHLTIFSFF